MGRGTYSRRKAEGLCVRCGRPNPRAPDRVVCGPCGHSLSAQVLDTRDRRLAQYAWKYEKARDNWALRQEKTR